MPPAEKPSFPLTELLAIAMAAHLHAIDPGLAPRTRLIHAKIALHFFLYIQDQNPDPLANYRLLRDHLDKLCAHLQLISESPQQN